MAPGLARRPLHERSDSDTNSAQLAPSSSVSLKTSAVSATKAPAPAKDNNNASAPTTRSNTVRTASSLDSLPPVPPLNIQKDRLSAASIARIPSAVPATESFVQGGPYYTAAAAAAADEFQDPSASDAPDPFRASLRRPTSALLPPSSSDHYREKSSAWAGKDWQYPIDRARMNARTLRLVRDRRSGSIATDISPIGSEQSAARRFSVPFSEVSAPSQDVEPGPAETQPPAGRQFPAWARYFYGKKGGRGSVVVPHPEVPEEEKIGQAITTDRRPQTSSGDSLRIVEIPHPRMMRQDGDSETVTLWSLPHLDHIPLTHFENMDRQIVLFCIGFIFPICWFVASFLPLPTSYRVPRGHSMDIEAVAMDLHTSKEARLEVEQRYENARWWRRVNRTLSVIGLLVIAAIVALVLVANLAK